MGYCALCHKSTGWFCFVHRRNICEHCCADLCNPNKNHEGCLPNCVVRSYFEWIADDDYDWPPRCAICNRSVPADPKEATRLPCQCLFHPSCLRDAASKIDVPPEDAKCFRCSKRVFEPASTNSPLTQIASTYFRPSQQTQSTHSKFSSLSPGAVNSLSSSSNQGYSNPTPEPSPMPPDTTSLRGRQTHKSADPASFSNISSADVAVNISDGAQDTGIANHLRPARAKALKGLGKKKRDGIGRMTLCFVFLLLFMGFGAIILFAKGRLMPSRVPEGTVSTPASNPPALTTAATTFQPAPPAVNAGGLGVGVASTNLHGANLQVPRGNLV